MRNSMLVALVLALVARPATGQAPVMPPVDTATVVTVHLQGGSELSGRVVASGDQGITLITDAGLRVDIPAALLARWRVRRGRLSGGRFRDADPNTSRLFFAPTGRTLERGTGYFADYYLFFPFVAAGVTNSLTIAGGMSLIPGASSQVVYGAPKVGIVRSPSLNVAVGGIYATIPGESGYVGAAYGVATFGDEDQAITVLSGFPFANGERTREPGVVVGIENRVGDRTKLLIEAWKLPGVGQVPALFGLRFFGNRVTADFGLVHVLGAESAGFPFIPWVDFVVSF